MAAITFADDLVRDYLLFRGFMGALKALDTDIKTDKDRGFRPDRIVDHLSSSISSLDLNGLRESWGHLDQRIFCRLEHSFLNTARKLETALLRMYVITCITNNRQDKLTEFFEKMMPELQGQTEWKDWFALPFHKSPEENPCFQVYFTRQWQDTMLMSLHNFLSVVFQSMAMPTLLSYEEELLHLNALQEENEYLKQKLSSVCGPGGVDNKCESRNFPAPPEIMDDFYVIAQETPVAENQGRTFRSLIRNISSGLPTSPLVGRKSSVSSRRHTTVDDSTAASRPVSAVKPKPRAPSQPPASLTSSMMHTGHSTAHVARVRPHTDHTDSTHTRPTISTQQHKDENHSHCVSDRLRAMKTSCTTTPTVPSVALSGPGNEHKSTLLLLSQEEYSEHHACITHCKFNCSGTVAASSDMEGVIKIWSPIPSPQTIASVMSRSSILALEWACKREKLLLHGNMSGQIKLYDTKDKRTVSDIGSDPNSPLKDQRVMCIVCSPSDSHFVCSLSPVQSSPRLDSLSANGKLLLWDLRTRQLERSLPLDSVSVNCCAFNHNGQLLVAGTSDGHIVLFDMRTHSSIAMWKSHCGETYSLQFSADETSCYTMGADGKFIQWSVNRTGAKISEVGIHGGAMGPFSMAPSGSQAATNHRHHPPGKMFAFDSNGHHVLTCGPSGGVVYKMVSGESAVPAVNLGGHRRSVVTVDWSSALDCGTCLTGSVDGKIQVSTLLAQ